MELTTPKLSTVPSLAPMVRRAIVVLLLLVGMASLLLGATWKYWHSPQLFWSDEQAQEYTNSWMALKAAATSGIRRADPATDPKVAAAQKRFEESKTKLEQAIARNVYAGTFLSIAGVGLIGAGIGLYSSRARSSRPADDR